MMFTKRRLWLTGFVFLSVALIGLSAKLLWQSQVHRWESRFAEQAKKVSADVRQMLDTNEAVLAGFSAFLQAVDQHDEAAANRYAEAVLTPYPHIYMLEVARAVPMAEQAQFEAQMRASWRDDFALKDFARLTNRPAPRRASLDATWPVLFMYPVLSEASAIYGVRLETVGHLSQVLAQARHAPGPVVSSVFRMYEGGDAYILAQAISREKQAPRRPAGPNFFGSSMVALLLLRTDTLFETVGQVNADPLVSITASLSNVPDSHSEVFVRPALPATDWDRYLLPLLEERVEVRNASQPMILNFSRQLRLSDILGAETLAILIALALMLVLLPVALLRHLRALANAEAEHERSAYLATHDVLTGLANRYLLADRFAQAVTDWQRHAVPFAVLVIDLDHFKQINDQHGHGTGDQVLKAIANRMLDVSRAGDTVARYGGDEFIILLRNIGTPGDAAAIAGRVLDAIRCPVPTTSGEQRLACSIGVALCPQDGEHFDALLAAADQAMYGVKQAGREGIAGCRPAFEGAVPSAP